MGSAIGSIGNVLAPIAGGALGSALGGAAGDVLNFAPAIGADIGGALGGAAGSALTGASPLGIGMGALGGFATGPSIDNFLGVPGMLQDIGIGSGGGFGNGLLGMLGLGGGGSTALPGSERLLGHTGAGAVSGSGLTDAAGSLAGGPTSATGGGGSWLDQMFGGSGKNSWLMPALGLGAAAMKGNSIPNQGQMTGLAQQAGGVAGMANAMQTGQLPPGAENMVQQSLNDAVTGIQSKYAQLGLSGSTMESQDIASAQQRAEAMRFQMATQATTTGLQALGISDQIYSQLAGFQLQQDQQLQDAIAGFAQAASGGGGGGNYKLVQA